MGNKSSSSSAEVKHFEQVLNDFKRILKLWKRYESLPTPTHKMVMGRGYDWKSLDKFFKDLAEIYASQKGCPSATIDEQFQVQFSYGARDAWESHKKRMVRELLNRLKTAFEEVLRPLLKVVLRVGGRVKKRKSVSLESVVENELIIPLAADINPHRERYLNGQPKRGQTFYTKGVFGEGSGGKGDSFSDFFRQELKTIVRPAEPIPVEPAVADSPDSWANAEDNSVGDNSRQVPTNIRESCARRLAPLPSDPVSPGRSPLLFVVPVLVFLLLMLLRRRFRTRLAPKRVLVRHGSRVLREEEATEPRADRV